jgi:hypothetical protein
LSLALSSSALNSNEEEDELDDDEEKRRTIKTTTQAKVMNVQKDQEAGNGDKCAVDVDLATTRAVSKYSRRNERR